jgi:hypothetical protein
MRSRVALARTDVSEQRSGSIIRVKRLGRLTNNIGITLVLIADVVPSSVIVFAPMMEEISSSETSTLSRVTRRHIPEDDILHSHRRENPQILYIALTG